MEPIHASLAPKSVFIRDVNKKLKNAVLSGKKMYM